MAHRFRGSGWAALSGDKRLERIFVATLLADNKLLKRLWAPDVRAQPPPKAVGCDALLCA